MADPSGRNRIRRRSAAVRLLWLWVRIPLGAWMSVSCECCMLSVRGLCDSQYSFRGVLQSVCLWSWSLESDQTLGRYRRSRNGKFIIIIIIHPILHLKQTINTDYQHVIQWIYVSSNFHCRKCNSCRQEPKYSDCVWLARSVVLIANTV